ncbi:hypothetical protein ACFSUK_14900 [Sphingobium scionense]
MTLQQKWAVVPPIHIVESEADMISDLAWAARDRFPDASQLLLEEVYRAQLCSRAALLPMSRRWDRPFSIAMVRAERRAGWSWSIPAMPMWRWAGYRS